MPGSSGACQQADLLIRSVCDGLSTACFIAALVHMKLADLAAVLQVSPLILAAFSVLFYRETVGWRRWTAIVGRLHRRAVRDQADAVGIRRLGAGGAARRDVVGAARDADPADRPQHPDHRDRLHGFDRESGRRRAVRRDRAMARRSRPATSAMLAGGRGVRRHRHLSRWRWHSAASKSRWWRRSATATCITSAMAGYLVFSELPDALVGGRRRADRGQRPLCAASRSGAPARDSLPRQRRPRSAAQLPCCCAVAAACDIARTDLLRGCSCCRRPFRIGPSRPRASGVPGTRSRSRGMSPAARWRCTASAMNSNMPL